MLNKFQTYYQQCQLFKEADKILLTVSGGKDSVFMVHLFLNLKLNFGIAHCNFKLRGEDADNDEHFVKSLAAEHNLPFYATAFNTKEYGSKNGISIQMAARDLRYAWFEDIRAANNFQFIATAHHKNDVAETMLINLTKGTGIAGLHGIKNKSGNIIRPLLCFTRAEIETYIQQYKIDFREDKSNADTKYVRNKIRHQVIPELEKINPSLINTMNEEAILFADLEEIIHQKQKEVKQSCVSHENELIKISIKALLKLNPLTTYLYLLIKEYGFNISDVSDIINGLNAQSGKIYYSEEYQIIKDRDFLIISLKAKNKDKTSFLIENLEGFSSLPITIKVEVKEEILFCKADNNYAYLDFEKIQFPLELRRWEQGDVFQPFGMKGNKKVSAYFVDEKFSLLEKEATWILTSNNEIVWLVGHRIDDHFKFTSKTKMVLVLRNLQS